MKITLINLLCVFCWCSLQILALPDTILIGGIFDDRDDVQEMAFRYAVEKINMDTRTLPRSKLSAQIERIPADDSFRASKQVCKLLRSGVAAIFGPNSENTANHVQSICDAMEVPHIETRWDYKLTRDAYSLNLYPYPPSLSRAYYDILMQLKWKNFVVLYDSNEGLVRLQTLLKEKSWTVTVRQLPDGTDFRPLLKEIRRFQATHIVLDVSQDKIHSVLRQAAQIGLMREYHNYFITSLDFNQVDLEDFRYGGTNITGVQVIDPHTPDIKEVVEKWKFGELRYGRTLSDRFTKVTTEAALMYDAVYLFAKALDDLDNSKEINIDRLYCEGDKAWQHGNSLINFMKWYGSRPHTNSNDGRRGGMYTLERNYTHFSQVQASGLTGPIKFDTAGFRSEFQLDILEMDQKETLKKVGTWTKYGGANYTRTWAELVDAMELNLQNRTLIVSTALTPPYTMRTESSELLHGNARFEGFCVDLIHEIAAIRGFNYTFQLVADGAYGSKNRETGEWDGIVRELLDHKADLGIVDFTITYEREEAVDFSMPFMNLGISIVYKKAQKKSPSLFSFMSPFSVDVWIYMATAYLGVSVLLFILARMAPDEWDCPYPCIEEPEELENSFTLLNSMWFIIGTFLCQGADIAPKAVSTRIVAGIWWFFTLIMISSYTANLAAFLTVERMDSPIESAEDLAKQTKIKYGCKQGGSTYAFFRDSSIPTYQRMWSAMSSARPSVFTVSNDAGVERVAKADGQYAFLMESSSIEYEVERKCDLTQVGGLLDSKSYGIALPPNSPYTSSISSAVLKLKEDGKLHMLKNKWWKERKGGGRCQREASSTKTSGAAELGLANVGGVFVVLLGGMGIAAFMAVCEFMWNARELATDESASFCDELSNEVKFIIKCSGNTKPVRKRAPSTPEEPLFTYGSYGANYGYSQRK
ncbi:glutamate receptor ionotropic, kainate 2 isoform X4 [Procambarus clarkii]|uniref:glutamate receptor ionotropic, kainate 2 isoform X4 n=1 Tax=Procambarus clarkii TaxID=6728 RepID=UPI001E670336|nr:glutamate receptor ionotropic, kainate 2-like isoform X2 [Procambarus clarkii]